MKNAASTKPRPVRFFTISALLALAALPTALAAQGGEEVFERDERTKLFVTDFTWYRPNHNDRGQLDPASLACTRAQPRRAFGEITASDYLSSQGYYGEKYERFKSRGVDGIAFVVTDRIPDSFAGSNLLQAAGLAKDAGLDFFAYYDLFVNSVNQSGLVLCLPGSGDACQVAAGRERIPAYNMAARPRLYDQLKNDFEAIARYLVQPHMDADGAGYLMLEDANGRRVLDEVGLPRPVIGIYIAREFADRPGSLMRIGELADELTDIFHGLGIGKPAFVLDVLYWATPRAESIEDTYDPDIVDAFGDTAVALTWYSFFDPYRGAMMGITNDGPRPPMAVWGKQLNQRYREARDEMAENGHALMLWPGATTQIDTRDVPGCRQRGLNIVYHLRSAEDWRTMLTRAFWNAWRPREGTPLQTVTIVSNAGEWFEMGGLDYTHVDRRGRCSFPYNWCTALLDVIEEEDRYKE